MHSELREQLRRALALIADYLSAQRGFGRAPDTDPLRGVAIEEAEAERLVVDLAATLDLNDGEADPDPGIADDNDVFNALPSALEWPISRAARLFHMRQAEQDALALALCVEVDGRFARLVAFLNDHISRTRPTIALALAVSDGGVSAVEFCDRPALRLGLLQTEGEGPLPTQSLRVAPAMLKRLVEPRLAEGPSAGLRIRPATRAAFDRIVINSIARDSLRGWAERMELGERSAPLLLAGEAQSGRATAAHAAASFVGRDLIETTWSPELADRSERIATAAREAMWRRGALLVRVRSQQRDLDFDDLWAAVQPWPAPVAIALTPDLVEAACASAPIEPWVVDIPLPTIEQREALWRLMLLEDGSANVGDDEIGDLAARYEFTPGRLARAVRRAGAEREDGGQSRPVDFASLSRACRAVGGAGMRPMAQLLAQPYTRDDLILPQPLVDELDLAGAWMRNRRQVFERWGFARRVALGRGLTALFSGEPGTGKTMAAQVLARELGLEAYRVDLSRMMSKYIGETEKNLSSLFDDARASGAMLFFDEADAMFGKRTEVKDAHDRYANLEISYLLQRMEEHTGTTVLATNRAGDLDEAFVRRFHFILEFPMPKAAERKRIWAGMLPAQAERDAALDLDELARDYEVSGGEIRNAVLSAAFMAASEHAPIGLRHLKRGLRRELIKSGRVLDARQRRGLETY